MALIFSRLILKTIYKINHMIGVVVCLIGIASIITADSIAQNATSTSFISDFFFTFINWILLDGTDSLLGDFFCLASSVLYAFSNVGQEYLVKQYSKLEYLATTGVFGSIISIIQL